MSKRKISTYFTKKKKSKTDADINVNSEAIEELKNEIKELKKKIYETHLKRIDLETKTVPNPIKFKQIFDKNFSLHVLPRDKFVQSNLKHDAKMTHYELTGAFISHYEPAALIIDFPTYFNKNIIDTYSIKLKYDKGGYLIDTCYLPDCINTLKLRKEFNCHNQQDLYNFVNKIKYMCSSYFDRQSQIQKLKEYFGDSIKVFSSICCCYISFPVVLTHSKKKNVYSITLEIKYAPTDFRPNIVNFLPLNENLSENLLNILNQQFQYFKHFELVEGFRSALIKREGSMLYWDSSKIEK